MATDSLSDRNCLRLAHAAMVSSTARTVLMVLMLAALTNGCRQKPPLGKVAGRVSYQGKPLAQGTVIFSNEPEGVGFQTPIQPDGSYVAEVRAAIDAV